VGISRRCLITIKLERLATMWCRNYNNVLSRFCKISERHGRSDRQTDGRTTELQCGDKIRSVFKYTSSTSIPSIEQVCKLAHCMGHFTFWISLSPRPKTKTKRLSVGLSPMLSLTNHSHASSLTSSAIHR